MRKLLLLGLWVCVLLASVLVTAKSKPATLAKSATATTPAEEALGRKVAEEIEKQYKLVKDDKMITRLNAMAAEIVPFTQRPDVVYNCRIIDTNDINAMSIPGGTIYFTKGLLKAVESDDELAGVMAHEMAHNSLYHVMKMNDQQKKHTIEQMLTVLGASVLMNTAHTTAEDGSKLLSLLAMSEYVRVAVENGYSQEVESQADLNGVQYLIASKKYNPLGLYSVILGFRQIENSHGNTDIGIGDHPVPELRARGIRQKLMTLKMPINVWQVVDFRAKVIPVNNGTAGYTVKLGTVDLFTYTAGDGSADAQQRAQAAAIAINLRLVKDDTRIQRIDVGTLVDNNAQAAQVMIRFTPVMSFTPADVKAASVSTLSNLAVQVKDHIQTAIFNETVKRGISSVD